MSKNVNIYQNNVALVKKIFYTLVRVEKVLKKQLLFMKKLEIIYN